MQPEAPDTRQIAGDDAAIRLALDYPYARHPGPFWFADGEAGASPDPALVREGRVPVVAFGSNAAPEQIARKFRGRPCGDRIYVEPVSLIGWDVVYAARLTGYRAIPARLAASPGCQAEVHLTWLTPAQLECMDRTEGQMYRRGRLVPRAVVDARGDAVAGAEAYLEGGNPLVVDGQQAALAAIAATGRACPGHFTRTLHERLARAAGFAGALDDFVRRLIRDAAYAERMQALLRGGL